MGGRQRAFSKCPGSLPPLNSLESEFIFSREFTVKKKKKGPTKECRLLSDSTRIESLATGVADL